MNNKIATGIWLVFIGAAILLHNLNIIHFNFFSILKYWPLALVSVGISLLLQNRRHGVLISIICNIAICSFLLYEGNTTNTSRYTRSHASSIPSGGNQRIASDFNPDTDRATLRINGGAASFRMVEPMDSTKLFEGWTQSSGIVLTLKEVGEAEKELVFETDVRDNQHKDNVVEFYLNQKPSWNMELNVGAANFSGDFAAYRLDQLAINAGASNMNLTFGQPQAENTAIEINTGASNLKLNIPKNTAYRVSGKNILSSSKYQDAKKVSKGVYQTQNYASAARKYDIKLNGAANSISVRTYSPEK